MTIDPPFMTKAQESPRSQRRRLDSRGYYGVSSGCRVRRAAVRAVSVGMLTCKGASRPCPPCLGRFTPVGFRVHFNHVRMSVNGCGSAGMQGRFLSSALRRAAYVSVSCTFNAFNVLFWLLIIWSMPALFCAPPLCTSLNYLIHAYKSSANLFINHWSHIKTSSGFFYIFVCIEVNACIIHFLTHAPYNIARLMCPLCFTARTLSNGCCNITSPEL